MASIKIIQKNRILANGESPIYLRITINRKKKLISLGLSCKQNQWNSSSESFRRNHKSHQARNTLLTNYKKKALDIIDRYGLDGKELTLVQFENEFRGQKKTDVRNVYSFWNDKIEDLKKSGQTGNSTVYDETLKSFFNFYPNNKIKFEDITATILEKYEIHLRSRGGTGGGISVKMRTIRAVYNDAIKKKLVKREHYPFEVYKISKLKGGNNKKALSREDVRKIENLDLLNYSHLVDARNYFVFSYYTRGMNFVDMMKLTWNNLHNNTIFYTRSKTKGNFVIKILPPVQKIIDYYQSQERPTQYVFPILLQDDLKPNQIDNRKKKTLKQYNKYLKEIGQIIGISQPLTSYVARHSFATNLKQTGISIAVISETLGHQSQEITETYLKAFENDVLDEAVQGLL
ncbi:MAG: site-specific integrase [Chitinophagales bacterium]